MNFPKSSFLMCGAAPLLLAAAAHAQITLVGSAQIPGDALDRSGLPGMVVDNAGHPTDVPNAAFGGAGSAIDYTGSGDLYLMAPDRGPSNGDVLFANRVEWVRIAVKPGNAHPVTVSIEKTTLLKAGPGLQYVGSSAAFVGNAGFAGKESLRLDPEGVRLSKSGDGSFWISDEYGPFVLQFNDLGLKIGEFALPSKYRVAHPDADELAELNANTTGRQTNRGMEGLAITPDGKTLVGLMQSPLIQDHGLNAKQKRTGTLNRLITMNLPDRATREFVYPMDDEKLGLNEILALSDSDFLVIERDGKSGKEAGVKHIERIDIRNATDISRPFTKGGKAYDYSGTTADNGLPSKAPVPGVIPVHKTLFLDLLDPAFHLVDEPVPEKFEGLAWGPDFENGDKLLIVTTDNDFLRFEPTCFYAFRVPLADLRAAP